DLFFFLNDTATTEIYTLSLHDALPISCLESPGRREQRSSLRGGRRRIGIGDRKSTRLNSSHMSISYAVFCLKKKNNQIKATMIIELSQHRQGAACKTDSSEWHPCRESSTCTGKSRLVRQSSFFFK